ncbi:hypothetical protein P280DRAFT_53107 [Massarina eburnea CBS 473.64]|uniref:BTB domain-containing protein n=1 Tax=Massarina eburnea CBS 473.64 TaxID=1395130 RepID=A0A6A6RUW6_9PLEO|nr:hypothetical protein P280DRAFT_53107 [Massarina eburnea CBS 473.64]
MPFDRLPTLYEASLETEDDNEMPTGMSGGGRPGRNPFRTSRSRIPILLQSGGRYSTTTVDLWRSQQASLMAVRVDELPRSPTPAFPALSSPSSAPPSFDETPQESSTAENQPPADPVTNQNDAATTAATNGEELWVDVDDTVEETTAGTNTSEPDLNTLEENTAGINLSDPDGKRDDRRDQHGSSRADSDVFSGWTSEVQRKAWENWYRPRETVLDSVKGNIVIKVGSEKRHTGVRRLIVSSRVGEISHEWADAVAKAKSKRSTMPWAHSERTITLPDDDADAMLILLTIFYGKFENVPAITFKHLVDMAKTCRRWNMNAKVRPYLSCWLSRFQDSIMKPKNEQWLNVAHQFGLEEDYRRLSKHLVRECQVDAKGRLFIPGTELCIKNDYPENCLWNIEQSRINALRQLLDMTYSLIDEMTKSNLCRVAGPDGLNSERTLCSTHNLGSAIRLLSYHGFWPKVQVASQVRMSVRQLAFILKTLPLVSRPVYCYSRWASLISCV